MNETIFVQELSSSKSQRVQADENLIIINILGVRERLALLFNLLLSEFQFFFFFFAKIECGLYFLDRFDVLISKMIFKK
jgi:hypothetical protein